MKTTAIISEFNPFHKGHEYIVTKAREITSADYVIALMSGDYVQRGECAIIDKYERADYALSLGFDAVIELPAYYCTSAADRFALGAVSILNHLGSIDYLAFGSETNDIEHLTKIASEQLKESFLNNVRIKDSLQNGTAFSVSTLDPFGEVVSSNDILAVSYIKALLSTNSSIKPVCIERINGNYNDTSAGSWSARSIRESINEVVNSRDRNYAPDFRLDDRAFSIIPDSIRSPFGDYLRKYGPLTNNAFSLQLYTLIQTYISSGTDLTRFLDVSSALSGKIIRNINSFTLMNDFALALKSKDMTLSRVRRGLLHILLSITDEKLETAQQYDNAPYARLLGFRKSSGDCLSILKKRTDIPLISKCADARNQLSSERYECFNCDIDAANMYWHTIACKQNVPFTHEFQKGPVIKP